MSFRPPTPADRLPDYGEETLRDFLQKAPADIQEALWDVIYDEHRAITYETATKIHAELAVSNVTVQQVIDGWLPAALRDAA